MTIKLGIIGAGWIADKMAETLNGLKNPEVILYAISSRNQERPISLQSNGAFPMPTAVMKKCWKTPRSTSFTLPLLIPIILPTPRWL